MLTAIACAALLAADFAEVKYSAAVYGYELPRVTMQVAPLEPGVAGQYSRSKQVITLRPSLCNEPRTYRMYVVGHEVGHAMVYQDYPQLAGQVVFHRHDMVTTSQMEAMADERAARLLTIEKDERADVQQELDRRCEGSQLFCHYAAVWQHVSTN